MREKKYTYTYVWDFEIDRERIKYYADGLKCVSKDLFSEDHFV